MRPALFTLRLSNGTEWKGSIHGSGGMIAGRDGGARILRAIERANIGRAFVDVAEPKPGHVNGVRTWGGPYELVDLRGATLTSFDSMGDQGGAS